MTWTYSFNPGLSSKDNVRFLLGDTNEKDQLLHDEEIAYMLSECAGNPSSAALVGCEAIMAKLSREKNETVGSVSLQNQQRLMGYQKLLATLRRRQAISGSIRPYSGGISRADKDRTRQDADAVAPAFKKHMLPDSREDGWDLRRRPMDSGASGWNSVVGISTGDTSQTPTPVQIIIGANDGGYRVHAGSGDPTSSTPGQPGDYYLNTVSETLFGPLT